MPKEDWIANPVHEILKKAGLWNLPTNLHSVLDVACGLSLKSKFLDVPIRVGVDIFKPYLQAIESNVPYIPICYDVTKLEDLFLPKTFDIVYALDIIEHIEKVQSIQLIDSCKKIAKYAVIIETPNGYIPQDIDIQGFSAHYFQTHRCGFTVKELENLGFQCVVRDYRMSDAKRHSHLEVDQNIQLIDAIYYCH